MKNKSILLFYIFPALLWAICKAGYAHNLEKINDTAIVNWSPERLAFMPTDRVKPRSSTRLGHPGIEYVLMLPNKWPQKQKLHVCFVGGSDDLRKKILKIADNWIKYTNLEISSESLAGVTCHDRDTSEIRIGFNEPGYWSYIGNDSVSEYLISNNLTSMNLEGFDINPPAEPRFTGIVLHEWGHALGLHHEHQSPASGCETEYDWPLVYQYYQTNYGWDKNKVDSNLKPLMADHFAFDWSPMLDTESNMIYASNPKFLKKGDKSPCFFHENNKLSDLDIKGIEQAYPKYNADLALKFQVTTIPFALQEKLDENTRKALQMQYNLTVDKINSQ